MSSVPKEVEIGKKTLESIKAEVEMGKKTLLQKLNEGEVEMGKKTSLQKLNKVEVEMGKKTLESIKAEVEMGKKTLLQKLNEGKVEMGKKTSLQKLNKGEMEMGKKTLLQESIIVEVEGAASHSQLKRKLKSGEEVQPQRKVMILDTSPGEPSPMKGIVKTAMPPPISYSPSASVEETVENWNWLYTATGVSWKLTEDLNSLRTSFGFKVKQLTGKFLRVFVQPLATRETSMSLQVKFCANTTRHGRMVITPMAAITIEHYKASSRATFQFHLMDAELANKSGVNLGVLMACCRIAFSIEDDLERRSPDDEVMLEMEDVMEGMILGVEKKEREKNVQLERQKKFSRDVEGKAWRCDEKQSGTFSRNVKRKAYRCDEKQSGKFFRDVEGKAWRCDEKQSGKFSRDVEGKAWGCDEKQSGKFSRDVEGKAWRCDEKQSGKFSRNVEGKAWPCDEKQSGSQVQSGGNHGSMKDKMGVKASSQSGEMIVLPDKCTLL